MSLEVWLTLLLPDFEGPIILKIFSILIMSLDYVSFQWIYDSFVVVAVFDVFVEKRVNNLNLNVLILDDLALIGARVKINYEVKH